MEILALNAFDPAAKHAFGAATEKAVERRLRSFGTGSVLFYEQPIEMVSAEGVWMQAADGRRYLDVYNNVPSVGHCHPRVVEAIRRQVGLLNINTRYLNAVVDDYAERLLATFPPSIDKVMLTCTGSEANDIALRVAETVTGGTGFIVTSAAYHGNTAAVTDISPSSRPGEPAPAHVRWIAPPDTYRGKAKDPGKAMARAVKAAVADMEEHGIRFAGAIFDSAFSSDGVFTDPVGLLKPVVAAVHAAGGLFIADEVQPGFGRMGEGLWGFARHGVTPDIVTMGKPMGNGFPMAGMALGSDLLAAFTRRNKYFNTFGGNPVAAAAGLAVLDVIRDEGLIENARASGDHLRQGLREIANRHVAIGDVRGAGLFTGLEFVKDRKTKAHDPGLASAVINALRDRGILIGAAGAFGNTLKIRPPLCFSKENAEMVVSACDDALSQIANAR
jgi:4-aminobutyrate aminotransferase-like enzyme